MSNTSTVQVGAAQLRAPLDALFVGSPYDLLHVEVSPVGYGVMNPVTHGLHHVRGSVTVEGAERPFAFVRKAMGLEPAGGPHPAFEMSDEPRHWNYWKREALAYGSALLPDETGGLRAPRCYAVDLSEDDRAILWLESLTGPTAERWAPERCAVAAGQLGRWQATLAGDRLPDEEWLSRGWMRVLLPTRLRREAMTALDEANWQVPLVREIFDPSLRERVRTVWDARETLLDALDALPQTLTHFDFRAPNLFEGPGEETVLIDWQFVGEGPLGQDLVGIVIDAVFMSEFPPSALGPLESGTFERYIEGARSGGWTGDPADVWLAYGATAALRFGLALGWLVQLANRPEEAAAQSERYGLPVPELLAGRVAAASHALDLGIAALERVQAR